MNENILTAITTAKEYYSQKKYRPGYPQSMRDTRFKENIDDIDRFFAQISAAQDPIEVFNLLTDRLTHKKAQWSAYDFNNYLIDALKKISRDPGQPIARIDWDCFTPTPVKRFEGVVYRGTSSHPEKVFAKGFSDYVPSSDIADYTKYRNINTGVSTSRSYDTAEGYTRVASRKGKSQFVYTIIYRGVGAVDIVETTKARGIDLYSLTNPQATRALAKDEINIISHIPPEQIFCATELLPDGSELIHYNPNYRGNYIVEDIRFANEKPDINKSLLKKIYDFFASIISFFKSFKWSYTNRVKIKQYGIDYRQQEIAENPMMQEAEKRFIESAQKNSFDLMSAYLSIEPCEEDTIITAQPVDASVITTIPDDSTNNKVFEITEKKEALKEPIEFTPSSFGP